MLHLNELWQHFQSLGFGVQLIKSHLYQLNINIQCRCIKDAKSLLVGVSKCKRCQDVMATFFRFQLQVLNWKLLREKL